MNTTLAQNKFGLKGSKAIAIAPAKRSVSAKAVDVPVIMCGATALSLAVGRFVFRPKGLFAMNAENCGRQLENTGTTGPESSFYQALEQSNDPAGFSIGDTIQYSAVGHIIGVGCVTSLQLQSAQYDGSYNVIPFVQLLQGVPYDEVKSTISGVRGM